MSRFLKTTVAGVYINDSHIRKIDAVLAATDSAGAALGTLADSVVARPEFLRLAGSREFIALTDVSRISVDSSDNVFIKIRGDEATYQVHGTRDDDLITYLLSGSWQ